MTSQTGKKILITDLDNTLWDWFDAWYRSFSAMLAQLTETSGVPQEVLEREIRAIHQERGTTEYSWLIGEIPVLIDTAAPADPAVVYDDAVHVLNSQRRATTRLYPGVKEGLMKLRRLDVRIVAYTESVAYWSEWRIRHTGLDGIIDVLYSAPDHDLPAGRGIGDLRMLPPTEYGLKRTRHNHIPRGVLKPNARVLQSILDEQGFHPEEAVYLGDSLMKDIAMAQQAGVMDVYAKYGESQSRAGYDLLRRVSHWSDADVAREREIAQSIDIVVPTVTCQRLFGEVLPLFERTLDRDHVKG
ncbi:HAD family hydrolase [Actinoplanes sp. NPDC051343]|uniref:HAD family hydrolase n=1 Tax=Actinoplanes sp. NPDC051343 TaxID=3363906 RepID=UPI003790BAB6